MPFRRFALLALPLAAAFSACGEQPALEVGPIGYGAQELAALGADQREELESLTAFGLVVADRRVDELVEPYIRRDIRSIVLQRLALEVSAGARGVDDAELRRAYQADPAYELEVRHLVILSERWRPSSHRDSARAVAREALARARAGEPFEALAAEYSDEPGAAARGGLLTPGREESWVPEFWEAASTLDEGELSGVVESEFGYHVLRLEDRRVIPFEEVRDDVLVEMVDLPSALGETQKWADSRMAEAAVDTAAMEGWWGDGDLDPETVLVRWPDAWSIPPFTAGHFREYVGTLRPQTAEAIRDGGSTAGAELLVSTARTHLLLEHARELGVEATASQRAGIERRWVERVTAWASAFGFEPAQSEGGVKQTALQALGAVQQSALQARAGLAQLTVRLRQLYPVTRHDEMGSPG